MTGGGPRPDTPRPDASASVVIPNWNGRDLLEKYLPSVRAALAGNPDNEIVVVDNGSTDGSAEWLRESFPRRHAAGAAAQPRLRRRVERRAFARRATTSSCCSTAICGWSPASSRRCSTGFTDEQVFAVSCQIFFRTRTRAREETGLTQAWWQDGALRVRHRVDEAVRRISSPASTAAAAPAPSTAASSWSWAASTSLLAPFYLEDTDLGYMAWKRGWKVLYQPRSVVYHEHRGTIGKRFSRGADPGGPQEELHPVLLEEHPRVAAAGVALLLHLGRGAGDGGVRRRAGARQPAGHVAGVPAIAAGHAVALARALAGGGERYGGLPPAAGRLLPRPLPRRWSRDPERLRVLFVSPYPICPPVHGGGVFMYQTLRGVGPALRDARGGTAGRRDWQVAGQRGAAAVVRLGRVAGAAGGTHGRSGLHSAARRAGVRQRRPGMADPPPDLYTNASTWCSSNTPAWRSTRGALRPHSGGAVRARRLLPVGRARAGACARRRCRRSRRAWNTCARCVTSWRVLPRFDQVQVCTRENRDYLLSFLPQLGPRLKEGLRAGIDTSRYRFRPAGREPLTMLFLGSFRHDPNRVALDWFIERVLPLVLAKRPEAKLLVIGSDPPPAHAYGDFAGALELRGFVEDIARAAGALRRVRLPDPERLGRAGETAGGVRGGHPGGFDARGRGGPGAARMASSACWRTIRRASRNGCCGCSTTPPRRRTWRARARGEVEANWDMAAITAQAGGGLPGDGAGARAVQLTSPEEPERAQAAPSAACFAAFGSVDLHVLLQPGDDTAGGAFQVFRGAAFRVSRMWTRSPGGRRHPPGTRCPCRGRSWSCCRQGGTLAIAWSGPSLCTCSWSFSPSFAGAGSGAGAASGSGGKRSFMRFSKVWPMLSVMMVSASLGSVTTWKPPVEARWLARNWSRPAPWGAGIPSARRRGRAMRAAARRPAPRTIIGRRLSAS